MDEPIKFLFVSAVGAVGQLLDGTLGMGFGVFSASMLLTAGLAPVTVVATVNTAKILTGIFSGAAHWRAGNVRKNWLLPLIVPGVAGGVLGSHLLAWVPQPIFRFWMAIVLVLMGLLIVSRCFHPDFFRFGSLNGKAQARPVRMFGLGLLGFAAGTVNAASGAYGPFATSGLMLITRARTSHTVGTVNLAESFVAASVVSSLFFQQGVEGSLQTLVVPLVLGGAVTAPFAAWVCRALPSKLLQGGLGLMLIALNLHVLTAQLG